MIPLLYIKVEDAMLGGGQVLVGWRPLLGTKKLLSY